MIRSLVLVCLVAVCVAKAPLQFADHHEAIPKTFLAVFNKDEELAARTVSQVLVEQQYNINGWRAAKVIADDIGLEALLNDPAVSYVEADRMSVKIDEDLDDAFDPMHNVMRGFINVQERQQRQDECQSQDTTDRIWGLTRTSSRLLPDYTSGEYHWDDETDGTGVDVYIIDTGIRLTHNNFGGRALWGFTAPNVGGIEDPEADLNGHGTHVGGTAAGGEFGVAKGATLYAVKVIGGSGSGTVSDIVAGVDWVHTHHTGKGHPKSVMNLSLGISPPSDALEAAIQAAIDAGVNTCVSARNNNRDACVDSPSRMEDANTCAASTQTDTLPSFTNFGPCVNVIAPGNAVLSSDRGSDTHTSTKSGTSMSAPHVAGVVARYLSGFADADVPDPKAVQTWIEDTSTKDEVILVPPKDTTPNRLLYMAC